MLAGSGKTTLVTVGLLSNFQSDHGDLLFWLLMAGFAREADIVRRHIVQEVLDDKRKFGVFAACHTAEPDLS
jgi:hypothetical protein